MIIRNENYGIISRDSNTDCRRQQWERAVSALKRELELVVDNP